MVGTQRLAILDVEAYAVRPRAADRRRALARAEARKAALLAGLALGAPVTRDERAMGEWLDPVSLAPLELASPETPASGGPR